MLLAQTGRFILTAKIYAGFMPERFVVWRLPRIFSIRHERLQVLRSDDGIKILGAGVTPGF